MKQIFSKSLFFLIFATVTISSSCEKPIGSKVVYGIWIQNNSNMEIGYLVSEIYPDTMIPNDEKSWLLLDVGERKAFEKSIKFEDYFASLPADTLSIIFFNKDTLLKHPFSFIRANHKVIGRKEVSLSDIEKSNTVTFP